MLAMKRAKDDHMTKGCCDGSNHPLIVKCLNLKHTTVGML